MISEDSKAKFLTELAESGIIAVAAKRVGISRSTIYEWKDTDNNFADQLEKALKRGRENWCDFSENQLHALIKEKQLGAIKFHLETNSPRYFRPRKPAPFIKEPAPINISVVLNKGDGTYETQEVRPEPKTLTEIIKRSLENGKRKDAQKDELPPPTIQ